jgi:hypothetical protein
MPIAHDSSPQFSSIAPASDFSEPPTPEFGRHRLPGCHLLETYESNAYDAGSSQVFQRHRQWSVFEVRRRGSTGRISRTSMMSWHAATHATQIFPYSHECSAWRATAALTLLSLVDRSSSLVVSSHRRNSSSCDCGSALLHSMRRRAARFPSVQRSLIGSMCCWQYASFAPSLVTGGGLD